jgi:hypothetical protein
MSDTIFKCSECNNEYNSYFCMWRHKKIKHPDAKKEIIKKQVEVKEENFNCKHCKKELSNRHSLWRHENKVCKQNPIIMKPITNINVNENTNSNINVIQHQTNNITINFTSLENQNVLDLKEEQKEEIINDGLNSIITLIKHLNFNKDLPQNHIFCTTNINNKYVNALNLETNKIEKVRKFDFFEEIFKKSLKHMKTLNNTIKNAVIQDDFEKKITSIEKKIFNYLEPTHKKIYHDDLNTLSYNQRDIVRKSWEESLSKKKTIITEDNDEIVNQIDF